LQENELESGGLQGGASTDIAPTGENDFQGGA
jgi:hypothetical protein